MKTMRGDTQFFIPFTDNFSRPKSLAHLREFFRTSLRPNAEDRVKLLQSRDIGKSWNEWSMRSPEKRNLSRDWWTKFESLSKFENKIESLKITKVKSYRYRYPSDRDERNEKLRKHMCWIKKVKVFSSCSAVK